MDKLLHFLAYVILGLFMFYFVFFVLMGFPHPQWAKKALQDAGISQPGIQRKY